MSYQSEAQLEEQLISQLGNQEYERVKIDDDEELIANFKIQFEKFYARSKCVRFRHGAKR